VNLQINRTSDGVVKYPIHTHGHYEIMYYLEGEGHMRTAVREFPFHPGTVIIMPPGIWHGSASKDGFRNISILGKFESYLNFDHVVALEDTDMREGRVLAELIYENRYGNRAFLEALCIAYICFLLQCFEIENNIDRAIKKIVSKISENALDPAINLTGILQKSGYSEDYIRAAFKKFTEKTPHEFLTDIRMNHACFLIDVYKNDLSLSEIAEKCGYLDYVYFSKKFKSFKGVSPKAYRDQ
jgi:AraC-like DNA-binding protein